MLKFKNEKEEIASALNEKEIVEQLASAISKAEEPEKVISDECLHEQLTPEEKLSVSIADHLAFMVAERFERVEEKLGEEAIKKLVVRIESSDAKTAVKMLQSMFLSNGMVHAAEELDILDYCVAYDNEAYNDFIDCLFDTDIFDWYSIRKIYDEFNKSDPYAQIDQEEVIWQIL